MDIVITAILRNIRTPNVALILELDTTVKQQKTKQQPAIGRANIFGNGNRSSILCP